MKNIPQNIFTTNNAILWGVSCAILFGITFFPAFKLLVSLWSNSEEYSHAFLIVPIILYIVWTKRNIFTQESTDYSTLGLILTIISVVVYPFALLTNVNTIVLLSMYFTITGILLYLAGFRD